MIQLDNRLRDLFTRNFEHVLQDYAEMTSRESILLDLLHRHKKMTISEIAENFSITASAASQLVKKMEQSHYLKREINLNNRREIFVSLDHKGMKFNRDLDDFHLSIYNKYYAVLSEKDIELLISLNKKILEYGLKIQQTENTDEA